MVSVKPALSIEITAKDGIKATHVALRVTLFPDGDG